MSNEMVDCPFCNDGKVKSGRVCPACHGEIQVTQERFDQIAKGMKEVEKINSTRTFWSQRR